MPVPRDTVGGALGALPGLGLVRCKRCHFEFVEPRPGDQALSAFYAAQDYTAHEPVDDAAAWRRAEGQLASVQRAGGTLDGARVLDVGCGGGQLLTLARRLGARVCGVDPAEHAHQACRRLGIEVLPQLDELGARRFDGIVMSHVLEHVPDVLATLAELRGRLSPGGWLCLEVPNRESLRARLSPQLVTRLGADERHRAFPIHLSYFTPITLRWALEESGLAVASMTTAGLGIDALWPKWAQRRDEHDAASLAVGARANAPANDAARAAPTGLQAKLRAAAKRRYFGALLGENLIVVARAAA